MGEFELIRQYFQPLAAKAMTDQLVLGPGDDCAIQCIPPGRDLVFSVDTLVEGVHFPLNYSSGYLGWRALAVAISDLAAMGAEPVCFSLALTLPEADPDWLSGFAAGLARASEAFGITLAGGDTTRGPLTISIQVHGTVDQGKAIRRSGARPGDLICVTGPLGSAGAALAFLEDADPDPIRQAVLARYHFPEPRLALGQQLVGKASAAIDISDGLLADLQHILDASAVGAELDARKIPMMPELEQLQGDQSLSLALTAGDDYELCIAIAPDVLAGLTSDLRARLTVVGQIRMTPGLSLVGADLAQVRPGFDHFGRLV
ncbi:thiamine-phosphate kinase [Marinobacter halophilus]|uniref:Thiamine-monophosphate kinase n=1 Tax=Marinobacter halophilus TaxID=1323740 RepID=A0A2T1KGA9_9GAMM|nr:thiamine-phosphate kinase [Marinobacter halophilus]PSF09159.1 thiamine-phosphate kinase [Marinobacter halophilus]GGC82850.1 thiamine-monophosphate kinase [Marinobacter halophilus]